MSDQARAFLAVVLSGVVIFGWQYFFAPPTVIPPMQSSVVQEQSIANKDASSPTMSGQQSATTEGTSLPVGTIAPEVTKYQLDGLDGQSFHFDNQLTLLEVTQGKNDQMTFEGILGTKAPLSIFVWRNGVETPIKGIKQEESSKKWTATDASLGISATFTVQDDGKLHYELHSQAPERYRFRFIAKPEQSKAGHPREFLIYSESVDRYEIKKDESGEKTIGWVAFDFDYHLFALTFAQKVSVNYVMSVATGSAAGADGVQNHAIEVTTNVAQTDVSGNIVLTKKNYDELVALGENLKSSVDFGIFGILAVPFLRCLQFFYRFFPNYGIGIILLTFILRLVTFPLQYKSFKGMKKMQEMQPEMAKIREKYKDDPSKLNQETMALFKRAGHNPLSGCFPILLQLPIFIALYRMLYSAVELVGAPFFGWITDLSVKDPFYILPVVMTIAMFLQQKMTPVSSADPTQEKIMLFMPLIFGFIMKDLPSGLNLYIFVSTVFGILQQLFVYRLMRRPA